MPHQWLQLVLLRDIDSIAAQARAYPSDAALWQTLEGTTNTGGTLALHLCGNLRHFVGSCLGNSGYQRDRAAEFATRDLSRESVQELVAITHAEVQAALDRLPPADLEQQFPEAVAGTTLPTGLVLTHLAAHLAYHLGQIDYHRRAVSRVGATEGMQSVRALGQ